MSMWKDLGVVSGLEDRAVPSLQRLGGHDALISRLGGVDGRLVLDVWLCIVR